MGGPERNKYQKSEEHRKQAESEQQNKQRSRATDLQQLEKFQHRTSYGGPPDGSEYAFRGNYQHLGPKDTGLGFSSYGPGGPRSESGASMSSTSSRFTRPDSIAGFDGPKDTRPSQVNVGNLELGARIWFNTRGVSLFPTPSVLSRCIAQMHPSSPRYIRFITPSRFEMASLARQRIISAHPTCGGPSAHRLNPPQSL